MSDPNMPHEPSGDPGATEENPLARLLFGWVEAPRTPGLLFWGMMILSALLILGDLVA